MAPADSRPASGVHRRRPRIPRAQYRCRCCPGRKLEDSRAGGQLAWEAEHAGRADPGCKRNLVDLVRLWPECNATWESSWMGILTGLRWRGKWRRGAAHLVLSVEEIGQPDAGLGVHHFACHL